MLSRSVKSSFVAIAAALVMAAAPAEREEAADLVIVRDGTARSIAVALDLGFAAAPVANLAEALGYPVAQGVLYVEGGAARFYEGSPFFTYGGRVHQLPNQVYRRGAQLMIPVSWALDWLPTSQPRRWRNMDGRLVESRLAVSAPGRAEPWVIVLDPGHGGQDPGTIGVSGAREKDLTLAVALRLSELLEREPDIDVVLTRSRDTLVSLAHRPRILSVLGDNRTADLFVSIHGNSMKRKPSSTRGFETYFLSIARTEHAREVALRENAAIQYERKGEVPDEELEPLQLLLSDLQSTGNLRESNLLAGSINRSMGASLSTRDLGVKQAIFTVLTESSTPAVLVEVGFLSNKKEDRQLRSSSYRAKIADALADGIVNYLQDYGRRVWSTPGTGG